MSQNVEVLEETRSDHEFLVEEGQIKLRMDRALRPVPDAVDANERTSRSEMFRLVQSVFVPATGPAPREVIFCGVDERNGSSSVCLQAGKALGAVSGKSVCLIDGNLLLPRLSESVGRKEQRSVQEGSMFSSERRPEDRGNLCLADVELLRGGDGGLLPRQEIKRIFAHLRSIFDYLLIDAPATTVANDTTTLGQVAGSAVIVLEANRTRRITALKELEALEIAGVRVLGTVLRDRTFPIPAALYNLL